MSKLSYFRDWNIGTAKHLLSRSLLGFTKSQLEFASSISVDELIENYLLRELPLPIPPGNWVDRNLNPLNSSEQLERLAELKLWWLKLMLDNSFNLTERMVLFFHNHFVTEAKKVFQTERIYTQNQLFRKYCFGNLKELTKEITIDGAMLWYLDGMENKKGSPNENYSRELLELFTIGIGNYSQEDVKAGALSLSGWTLDLSKHLPVFDPRFHDGSEKTFLGRKGSFDYEDIIEIIFSKRETSLFFCRKICKEFLEPEPNIEFTEFLADIFIENNFEIKPVLSALFKSEYFYSSDIKGSRIKSPIEFLIGLTVALECSPVSKDYLVIHLEKLDQILFDHPDVRGWIGHKKWINVSSFPARNSFSDSIVSGYNVMGAPIDMKMQVLPFARRFQGENINVFLENIISFLFPIPLSDNRKAFLKEILLEGSPDYSWSLESSETEPRLINFFKVLFKLPEYQIV